MWVISHVETLSWILIAVTGGNFSNFCVKRDSIHGICRRFVFLDENNDLILSCTAGSAKSVLISSCHLRQGVPSVIVLPGFRKRLLYEFLISRACCMSRTSHSPRSAHTDSTCCRALVTECCPVSSPGRKAYRSEQVHVLRAVSFLLSSHLHLGLAVSSNQECVLAYCFLDSCRIF